jgi:hypothetical protein
MIGSGPNGKRSPFTLLLNGIFDKNADANGATFRWLEVIMISSPVTIDDLRGAVKKAMS